MLKGNRLRLDLYSASRPAKPDARRAVVGGKDASGNCQHGRGKITTLATDRHDVAVDCALVELQGGGEQVCPRS